MQIWMDLCDRIGSHALLEMVLYKFEQISATGNALMLLATIFGELGLICVPGNAHLLLEMILSMLL